MNDVYSVGRVSEWEGLISRGGVLGGGVPLLHWGRGLGGGYAPSPEIFFAFLHQNHTSVMHSDTLLK